MITIKDIAKKCGVSCGTVSNVLNKRGNTSLKKIQLVEQTAKELGYFFNETASSLRSNKKKDIALILPTINNSFYRKIFMMLYNEFNSSNIKLTLHISNFNPQAEMDFIYQSVANNKFLIIASCLSDENEFYTNLSISDSELIFINSKQTNNNSSFSCLTYDYKQFFTDLNEFVTTNNYKKILFFTEKEFPNQHKFSFYTTVTCVSFNDSNDLSSSIEALYDEDFDLIVTTSLEKFDAINAAKTILNNQKSNCPIISIVDNDYLPPSTIIPYYQDTSLLVHHIIRLITQQNELTDLKLKFNGFTKHYFLTMKDEFINILMIDCPATKALIKIKSYIENKIGFKFNIDIINYTQYDLLTDEEFIKKYDLLRIDMAYLPTMARKFFSPLDMDIFQMKNKFIDNLDEYIFVDDIPYALPFDVSCLVMLYRSDILNNQLIQRQFYEQNKSNSIIPKNYDEYNCLENFFSINYKDVFKPSTVCIGSSITTSNEFLTRLDKNYTFSSDIINFEDEPIKIALESYLGSVKHSKNNINMFWDDVIKQYSEGSTILSIVYSNYIHLLKDPKKDILFKTEFTQLPNNYSYIGGGVFGLTKHTTKKVLAYNFLKVLYSDEICKLLTHLGATLPTKSIYNDFGLTSIYPWLRLMPEALANNKRSHYNNKGELFNTIEFEKSIGRQVKKFIESKI